MHAGPGGLYFIFMALFWLPGAWCLAVIELYGPGVTDASFAPLLLPPFLPPLGHVTNRVSHVPGLQFYYN